MKRMNEIETNDVEVTPHGTISSGTMTYEAHKLGSMYIVRVKTNIDWDEGGNGWKFTIKGKLAYGTWISGSSLSLVKDGLVLGNPRSGIAIIY